MVICHSIYQYARVKDIYMNDYDKNKKPSYIQYWAVNNLYGFDINWYNLWFSKTDFETKFLSWWIIPFLEFIIAIGFIKI